MTIVATGIDLAKSVFAVHGVNATGGVELRQPRVPRAKLHALIASLPPGLIGMEACSGANHWARLFQAHGHTVRLIAPKLVTPNRMSSKRGKNDATDAAAVTEAMQRPTMRFVPIKTVEQQYRLMVHRAPRATGEPEQHLEEISPTAKIKCFAWATREVLSEWLSRAEMALA